MNSVSKSFYLNILLQKCQSGVCFTKFRHQIFSVISKKKLTPEKCCGRSAKLRMQKTDPFSSTWSSMDPQSRLKRRLYYRTFLKSLQKNTAVYLGFRKKCVKAFASKFRGGPSCGPAGGFYMYTQTNNCKYST